MNDRCKNRTRKFERKNLRHLLEITFLIRDVRKELKHISGKHQWSFFRQEYFLRGTTSHGSVGAVTQSISTAPLQLSVQAKEKRRFDKFFSAKISAKPLHVLIHSELHLKSHLITRSLSHVYSPFSLRVHLRKPGRAAGKSRPNVRPACVSWQNGRSAAGKNPKALWAKLQS